MRALLVCDAANHSDDALRERARAAWSPGDANVLEAVTTPEERQIREESPLHLALIDCGVKEDIIRSLKRRGVRITVVPYDTPAGDVLALGVDGVLTSPGPGDPVNSGSAVEVVRTLIDSGTPYMGVCLGHQLLALAVGARTSKLKFGHRGGNHPVKDLTSGAVHITSQNHGYQVDAASVPTDRGWRVSQINLNDGSVEGLEHESLPVFSIQYHPEGSPGPQDNQYLFDRFIERVRQHRGGRDHSEPTEVARSAGRERE
jgi:carbamoyl-phosphate synthase small subunit